MTSTSCRRSRIVLRPGVCLVLITLFTLATACGGPSAPAETAQDGGAFTAAPAPEKVVAGRARVSLEESLTLGTRGATADADVQAGSQASDPMLIRTGSARLEVDSIETAVTLVEALAARLGGMVVNSAIQTGARQYREASLSIKIPAVRFDEAVGGLAPVGRLESLHVNTEDVGEEFVDITARLASARQLEQRLLEILRTRTGKLEEVLAVERELARVRAEIERYEGRLRYLRGRVDMSVLAISLHEPKPVLASSPGVNVIREAIKQAWRNFVALVATAIAALGFLLPIGLFLAGIALVVRRIRRAPPASPRPLAAGGAGVS